MRYDWVPPWAVIGVSMVGALAYVGVSTAQCFAHEPADLEPAPLGAAIVGAAAMSTTTSFSIGAGAFDYAPNMTGDEPIKVVQSIEQYALCALQPARFYAFKPGMLPRAQSSDDPHVVAGEPFQRDGHFT